MSAGSSRWRTIACIRSGAISRRRSARASRRTKSRSAGRCRLRGALRRSGAAERVPRGDDRHQPRREHDDRASAFPGRTTARSSMSAPRRAIWPRRSRSPTRTCAASGSTCRRSHRFSRSTSRHWASPIASRSRRATSSATHLPQVRRRADGPHPARLGSADEEDADREGVRRHPARRRADRLRGDHRRRPIEECVRADDEPQHADRDARRVRLHRRRLRRLDARRPGSRSTRVEPLVGPDSMVIGIK